jgi:hypothetical protein
MIMMIISEPNLKPRRGRPAAAGGKPPSVGNRLALDTEWQRRAP